MELKKQGSNYEQLCGFMIGDGYYAIPVLEVQEVVKPQGMTTVPLASPSIRGLMNLRGQIVTALDMKQLFDIHNEQNKNDKATMNIIVTSGESLYSLIVDKIMDVIEVDNDSFENVPETLPPNLRKFIKGVYKLPDKLLIRLDLDKVLKFDEN